MFLKSPRTTRTGPDGRKKPLRDGKRKGKRVYKKKPCKFCIDKVTAID
jgi:hypothetical protein